MNEVLHASVEITVCTQSHVHIRMTSVDDTDCPTLDRAMDPDMARSFACAVLEAANGLSPVS